MDTNLRNRRRTEEETMERPTASGEIDAGEFFRIIWRRKYIVLACALAIMLALSGYLALATPLYTASLNILFESKAGAIFDIKAVLQDQPQDEASILSEIEVVKSRSLAGRVINQLGLDQDPEFNLALRPESPLQRFVKANTPDFLRPPPPEVSDEDRKRLEHEIIVDRFLERLKARQIPSTRTITVKFASERPEKAAMILNTLAELYLVARLEDRFANAKRSSDWLAARVQSLRKRVEESEKQVEDYRRRHNLFEGERASLVAQQISDINSKVTDAQIERTSAEANLAQARRLAQSSASVDSATQVLSSELIRRFREDELDIERREAEAGEKYGARHPAMIQLQAEKKRLKDKLREEIRKIELSLENQVQIARSRETALNRELQSLKSQLAEANQASIQLHSLERDAEANRLLLEKFLTSFMEASAQESVDSQVPDARIISPAPTPREPSSPQYLLLIAVGLLLSSATGVAVALVIEYLDAGFRSAEQVEHETGLSVLAHVPFVPASRLKGQDLSRYVIDHPHSAFAESVRSAYTQILLASGEGEPRVVLFSSAQAEEGKTSTSFALARQLADSGQKRVIFLDTDCHRSTIAEGAGIKPAPGFSDVLQGTATLREAIQIVPNSALHVLVAGDLPKSSELIDREKVSTILQALRADYDLVVVDTPPVLAISGTSVLASLSDLVILVVRWGVTRRRVVAYAIHQLTRVGVSVQGVILSMVDIRKHAQYSYGDSGYYYGKYRKYYATDR